MLRYCVHGFWNLFPSWWVFRTWKIAQWNATVHTTGLGEANKKPKMEFLISFFLKKLDEDWYTWWDDANYEWVLLGAIGCYWVLLGTIGCLWVLLGTFRFFWVLIGANCIHTFPVQGRTYLLVLNGPLTSLSCFFYFN